MTHLCIPELGARGERWHWLRDWTDMAMPARWFEPRGDYSGSWSVWGVPQMTSEEAARKGYRWIAVAKPPEGT